HGGRRRSCPSSFRRASTPTSSRPKASATRGLSPRTTHRRAGHKIAGLKSPSRGRVPETEAAESAAQGGAFPRSRTCKTATRQKGCSSQGLGQNRDIKFVVARPSDLTARQTERAGGTAKSFSPAPNFF